MGLTSEGGNVSTEQEIKDLCTRSVELCEEFFGGVEQDKSRQNKDRISPLIL